MGMQMGVVMGIGVGGEVSGVGVMVEASVNVSRLADILTSLSLQHHAANAACAASSLSAFVVSPFVVILCHPPLLLFVLDIGTAAAFAARAASLPLLSVVGMEVEGVLRRWARARGWTWWWGGPRRRPRGHCR